MKDTTSRKSNIISSSEIFIQITIPFVSNSYPVDSSLLFNYRFIPVNKIIIQEHVEDQADYPYFRISSL